MDMLVSHSGCIPRDRAAAVAVAALALLAPVAAADPIGYTLSGDLYRVDLATFEVEAVGPTGGVFATHLTFHADGTLYGLASSSADSLRLVSFDLVTGAGEVVADLDPDLAQFDLEGFAGDSAGGLWAMGRYEDAAGDHRAVIFAVDPTGGAVGEPVEIAGIAFAFDGLAACGDRLLSGGLTGIHAIDPLSGGASLLLPTAWPVDDMGVDPDGGLWILYALPISGIFDIVVRVDLATGEIIHAGDLLAASGLAVAPPPTGGPCAAGAPLTIPTLSPLALLALAVSLAGAAVWIVRRRG